MSLMLYQINGHKLVSIKFKTNYIRCIYHLKGDSMKNVKYTTSGVTIFVFKCHYLWPSNSLFRKYNQFGNLTLSFALFRCLKKNFNYQIFCRVTYVTGCYSLTLPFQRANMLQIPCKTLGFKKNMVYKIPPHIQPVA